MPPAPLPAGVAFVKVADARRALALGAAKFFPRQPEVIAAVTGTSGKTSVAAFTRQIWTALGKQAASIGTIGLVSPKREVYGSLTTPDPVALHRSLDELAGEGVTHLAMEASSHGLDQRRLDGVRIAAGGFTNLSRDHLDYHPTLEAYLAAKLRLFTDLIVRRRRGGDRCRSRACRAVVAAAKRRAAASAHRRPAGEGIRLLDDAHRRLRAAAAGSHMPARITRCACRWSAPSRSRTRWSRRGLRLRPAASRPPCSRRSNISRAPRAGSNWSASSDGAPIFVDYAHKPDALAKALEALRPYVDRPAGRGVRLRRRPRRRQAADDGRDRGRNRPTG